MREISIKDCRTALQSAWCRRRPGLPLTVQGRQVVIDQPLEVQGKHWVCGDLVLRRPEKVALTKTAREIIAKNVTPFPPWKFPPAISHIECLKAIEQAGGLSITHRGEPLYITEISIRNSHWWSGGQRLTEAVKCLLTKTARDVLNFEHSWIAPSD